MFDWLITFSGYLIIGYCWFGLITPFLLLRKKYKLLTISQMETLPKYRYLVNLGLLFISLLQVLFVNYISIVYPLADIWLPRALFLLGVGFLFLSGIVSCSISEKWHLLLAKLYFLLISLGALLISIFIMKHYFSIGVILTAIITIKLSLIIFIGGIRKNILMAEMLGILFSGLWAIVIYSYSAPKL